MTGALLVAKAPVVGEAKTRLAASVGNLVAAELAAAALLDTIEVCADAFDVCLLAFSGDLETAVRGSEVLAALEGWTLVAQRGGTLGERLFHAHNDAFSAAGGPVIQLGMDTPQVTARQLAVLDSRFATGECDAVLGPAEDGGWWVLGTTDPRWLDGLSSVPTSTPRTGPDTLRLLLDNGARVALAPTLRDVDEAADAEAVSRLAPGLRFSTRWSTASPVGEVIDEVIDEVGGR